MKRAYTAPLCSAFVLPGLGQILNQDIRKGLGLMAAVFALLILGAVQLYLLLSTALQDAAGRGLSSETVLEQLRASDFTGLWVLGGVFALIWIYAVVDAFLRGRRLDFAGGPTS